MVVARVPDSHESKMIILYHVDHHNRKSSKSALENVNVGLERVSLVVSTCFFCS